MRASFGSLSNEQLNWKPAADSWSVAAMPGSPHPLERRDETSVRGQACRCEKFVLGVVVAALRFFRQDAQNSLRSDKKKFKAPSDAIVPPSDIPPGIVDRFAACQERVMAEIEKTAGLDWDKTVVTSPFMGLITYRLRDAHDIVVEHSKRHLRQAKRVMNSPSFPQ